MVPYVGCAKHLAALNDVPNVVQHIIVASAACQRRDWPAHRSLCQQIVDTKYGGIPTEAGERGGVIFTDACFNN